MSEAEFTCDEGDYLACANSPERQEKKALRELGTKNKKETKMSNEALKPCPFCGADGVYIRHMRNKWVIGCSNNKNCSAHPMTRIETRKEAIAAWNTRVKEEENGKA